MIEPLGNKPKILNKNIEDGYVMRYFARHVSRRDILEIDQLQFNKLKISTLYETMELKWFIVGQDAINKNEATIKLYTDPQKPVTRNTPTMLIGLKSILRSPREFVIS